MLSLRHLEEGTVKDTKEDCCDKDVTTCRDFTANEDSCGEGRMPLTNKDNFADLIYKDEASEKCCEKRTYVVFECHVENVRISFSPFHYFMSSNVKRVPIYTETFSNTNTRIQIQVRLGRM